MGLTMKEKKSLTRKIAPRYRKANKKEKGRILNEFVQTTGYTRKYASWILRMWGKKKYVWIDGELIELKVGYPKKRKRKKR